ncbi:MAG TPA: hypothetical protein VIO38_16375 [Rariglobus sp.]
MDPKTSPWQTRFGLKTCAARDIATAIPAATPGIAVVYAPAADGETVYLVLESRAGSLRDLCAKRLSTAKIPAGVELTVAFKGMPASARSPEAVGAACREQVILAGELRRELRPAMR